MPANVLFHTLSGLIFVLAFLPYIKAIVKNGASPRKATWLIWATGDIIIVAGMIAKETISGLMICAVIGASTTFLLSLKYGELGWKWYDSVCVALSTLALSLWVYLGDSNFGIGLSLVALWIAAWPTYISAWQNPRNEDRRAWILFNLANVFGLLAVHPWTFPNYSPPITFTIIDVPMLYLLFVRPYYARKEVTNANLDYS